MYLKNISFMGQDVLSEITLYKDFDYLCSTSEGSMSLEVALERQVIGLEKYDVSVLFARYDSVAYQLYKVFRCRTTSFCADDILFPQVLRIIGSVFIVDFEKMSILDFIRHVYDEIGINLLSLDSFSITDGFDYSYSVKWSEGSDALRAKVALLL